MNSPGNMTRTPLKRSWGQVSHFNISLSNFRTARPLRIEFPGALHHVTRVEIVAKTSTPMTLTAAIGATFLAACALVTSGDVTLIA